MLRLAALIPIALVACVSSGDEGMYIVKNIAVTDSCVISASPDTPFRSKGLIHSDSTSSYFFTPLIQSRFTASTDGDDVSRTVQLRRADVKLTVKAYSVGLQTRQADMALPTFSSLFSGALPPGGFVSVGFDIVTPSQMATIMSASGGNVETDEINAEVLAEITVRGVVNDDDITSNAYVYPVTICNRCVFLDAGACPVASPRLGNACNPYQDGVVDCCTETTGEVVCPARTM